MPIVGGLDIHRRQITFDYLDTVTGQVRRGQIAPADREHLRAWLARFAGRDDVAFAVEGCAGWRYVAEELAAAGIAAHLAEPADTAFARGRKRRAKTDRRAAPGRGQGAGRPAVRGRAGDRAGDHLLAGRGPVLLLPPGGPVRRAGASPSRPRTARARPGACPGRDRRCCAVYEAGKTHARTSAPDHRYYAAVKDRKNSKRACLSEARKILRQAHHILAELGDDALAAA